MFLVGKICERLKMPKFWTANALFNFIFGKNFKKLLPHFKSTPSHLSFLTNFCIGSDSSRGPGSAF